MSHILEAIMLGYHIHRLVFNGYIEASFKRGKFRKADNVIVLNMLNKKKGTVRNELM